MTLIPLHHIKKKKETVEEIHGHISFLRYNEHFSLDFTYFAKE